MRLFVTGASGLVGRRLLAHAAAAETADIVALSRREQTPLAGVRWARGDLREPSLWRSQLGPGVVVAHLAAATGAAAAAEMHAVNAEATHRLVAACEATGVAGLLFVSSIAARFAEDLDYPYAASKRAAEAHVRAAALPTRIVRPTMVLGPGSPILARLRTLACAPRPIVIGSGRARVQPLGADALGAELAHQLLAPAAFGGQTCEIGGPRVLTIEELLHRVREAAGRPPARAVRLPHALLRALVAGARAVLGHRLPLHPGQLASFVRDGVAEPGPAGEPPIATPGPFEPLLAAEAG